MGCVKSVLPAMMASLALQGCAHTAMNKHIDDEVAQETSIKTHADLNTETSNLIETAPGLSAAQRTRLIALRDSTHQQLDEMRQQCLKLKAVLIKNLITTNNNDDEVSLIERRIKKLENKQLALIFSSAEQANKILGRNAYSNQRIVEEYWEDHRHRD